MEFLQLGGFIVGAVITILIIRLFGAWMLRIDEIITLLRDIKKSLQGEDFFDNDIERKAYLYDKQQLNGK